MAIKGISKQRFEALCFMRLPQAKLLGEEREWYADDKENVLGVVIQDRVDQDWSYVVLGRDEVARFRAIDESINHRSINDARTSLHSKMEEFVIAGEHLFPQGLKRKNQKTFLIFKPIVPGDKLHPDFALLSESSGYSSAREIIAEIAYTFEDPDGNYIQQFQTEGFDARLWELYLYAVLHEEDFLIDRTYKAPDYSCSNFGESIVLEATTVNPKPQEGDGPPPSTLRGRQLLDYMAIKFGNSLFSKLKRRYWEQSHVKGKPLILAVADLRKPETVTFSAPYLMQYLYGMRQEETKDITYRPLYWHSWGKQMKPSGFFFLPDAENISAVLFSDSGTISKFNRMGKLAGFGDSSAVMARVGERYACAESEAPEPFTALVEPDKYTETWSEGIWVFHNPRASFPVKHDLFPDVAHVYLENDGLEIYLSGSFPVWSQTLIFSTTSELEKFMGKPGQISGP